MTETVIIKSPGGRLFSFLWQHMLLCISLFVMTFGVALCVRSDLGSSVISTIPFVMSLAGASGGAPELTIGEYTYIMNFVLVGLQIAVLGRKFEVVQLLQLVIGFLFGFLLDINMALTSFLICDSFPVQGCVQFCGCLVLAVGISMEIRCGSVTMPGEGFPVAVSRVSGVAFARTKIFVDVSLVIIAVVLGYVYFDCWLWKVVGPGTLVAMILVGALVRLINPYMMWFEKILHFRPGVKRYLYGLAKFLYHKNK